MKRRFPILVILLLAAGVTAPSAQTLPLFRERLAEPAAGPDGDSPARITVTEHGDAADAVAKASRENARLRFRGYRVCIFFDNGQNARSEAQTAGALFASTFPDIPLSIVYNSPYFTVTVGNCVTAEEAIILMGKVKHTFPKAFLKSEELFVADLVE